MKIVSTGRTISTSEYLEKKRRAKRRRLYAAGGALLVLIAGVIFALRLQSLRITEVAAEGAPATGAEEVERKALEFLSGSYFWLVPKANAFVYPKSELEAGLRRAFPRLSSVSLSLEGTRLLRVKAVERKPYALYCGPASPEAPQEKRDCYFLDEGGFIFDSSPVFSEGVYFMYAAEPALEHPLGRQFVPPGEFESLAAFVTRLKRVGADPLALSLSETEGRLALAGGGTLVFSRRAETDSLAQALESFLGTEAIKAKPDFWRKLDTLDMRTANKVFYTFREE